MEILPNNTTMCGHRYTEILARKMLSRYRERGCTFFFQDGAPCHTSKHSMGWLKDNGVKVLPWPGNSPDLNPIENAWNVIKNRLKNRQFKNLGEL